jgi:hypothetical protein
MSLFPVYCFPISAQRYGDGIWPCVRCVNKCFPIRRITLSVRTRGHASFSGVDVELRTTDKKNPHDCHDFFSVSAAERRTLVVETKVADFLNIIKTIK